MKAQEVAHSVPRPFTGIVCPELPVGSPEREELFAQFRETFDEDWKAAEEAVARERIAKQGDLYFIRCADAVKIGRTVGIVKRLANMQVNNPHEIDCILLLKGRGLEEGHWHKRFKGYHIRGEWFWWAPDLEAAVLDERERNRTTRYDDNA